MTKLTTGPYVNQGLQLLADLVYMSLPRRRPSQQALLDCKLVSHRGEHDNRQVRENTLAAFTRVQEAGVWGIEFDVRWTRDLEPVVLHDADTRRVFQVDLEVAAVDLTELRDRVPEVPTWKEVVDLFGGRLHLMVELKADETQAWSQKRDRIREIFAGLKPADDYHFLALEAELFDLVDFAGNHACLPVAEYNISSMSRQAMDLQMAGLSGQYLLLGQRLIHRHRAIQQKIGTGFPASRCCFYRELNRGVDWIFTNHALKLATIRQELLRNR